MKTDERFTKIYNENRSKVLRYVSSKINNRENAEELTNDVFIKVRAKLDTYDESKAQFNTWMYTICKHVLIDHFRKAKVQTVSLSPTENTLTDSQESNVYNGVDYYLETEDRNPLEEMITNESLDLIKNAIKSLPALQRKVITLFAVKSKTYEEISEELDMPMNTVKGTIFHARTKLKKFLPKNKTYEFVLA